MAFNPNLELPTDSKFSDLLLIVDGMAANKQASAQYTIILYTLVVTSIFSKKKTIPNPPTRGSSLFLNIVKYFWLPNKPL